MIYKLKEDEFRSLCRKNIESLEIWARRLINEKLSEKYGDEFVDYKTSDESFLIKKEIRDHIKKMMKAEPERFCSPVDTLFFEHIISILCNPRFYEDLFKPALKYAYPDGCEEARTFLKRIRPVRNALSHANPISVRQAEQAICYSQDFIDGLKEYYKNRGEEKMWNVPRIIRISDSEGNIFDNPTDSHVQQSIFRPKQKLRYGEMYSVDIDVDPAFSDTEYDIEWKNQNNVIPEFKDKTHFVIEFREGDVSENHTIRCTI